MTSDKKHSKADLPDFIRYLGKRMTHRERNAFEKELQKDSFASEAAEGFEGIAAETVQDDINLLSGRLGRRTNKGYDRRWIYRVAASVALLALLGTVTVMILRNQEYTGLEPQIAERLEFEITRGKSIKTDKKDKGKAVPGNMQVTEETAIAQNDEKITPSQEKGEKQEDEIVSATRTIDTALEKSGAVAPDAVPGIAHAAEKMMAPAVSRAALRRSTEVRGKIVSAEDNLPIAGASVILKGSTTGTITDTAGNFSLNLPDPDNKILQAAFVGMVTKDFQANTDSVIEVRMDPSSVALSEVVVVGYGSSRKAAVADAEEKTDISAISDEQSEYKPPVPDNGKEEFNRYIEENIRNPESFKGQRAVVVISFTVASDGSLKNIRTLRSPGDEFSNEAIRLIKEGPGWKPATENGEAVDDEVRIRIVFR